ncbi:MAG: histidine phosphatase family protein [Anaerolineae bacterium]
MEMHALQIYLLRHGHEEPSSRLDPYGSVLSAEGRAQAARLAAQCKAWEIQFLVASHMVRAEQTADAIEVAMPGILRWDLQELEEINLEDLAYNPGAGPRIDDWTPEQLAMGYRQAWVRITAALARIELFARGNALDRIAILAHETTINLLLFNWLGLDWRAAERVTLTVDYGATCKVALADPTIRIEWINRG